MKTFSLFALFICVVEGSTILEEKLADEYIDIIIKKAGDNFPDPLHLPDFSGWAEYTEGLVWEIKKLRRVGPTKVTIDKDKHIFEANLGHDEVFGRYTWTKYILYKYRSGFVFILATNFTVYMRVTQSHDPGAFAKLEELRIRNMDIIDIDVTGLNYITWIFSKVSSSFPGKLKRTLKPIVERRIFLGLEQQFEKIRLPIIDVHS